MPNLKYLLANWSGALTEAHLPRIKCGGCHRQIKKPRLRWLPANYFALGVGLSLFRLISSCPSEVIID